MVVEAVGTSGRRRGCGGVRRRFHPEITAYVATPRHRDRAAGAVVQAARGDGFYADLEMSAPHPAHEQNLELPIEELLRRATVHPPYGEQVIDDLTPEEADAFLDAVLS